jgi:hypothetical protein
LASAGASISIISILCWNSPPLSFTPRGAACSR